MFSVLESVYQTIGDEDLYELKSNETLKSQNKELRVELFSEKKRRQSLQEKYKKAKESLMFLSIKGIQHSKKLLKNNSPKMQQIGQDIPDYESTTTTEITGIEMENKKRILYLEEKLTKYKKKNENLKAKMEIKHKQIQKLKNENQNYKIWNKRLKLKEENELDQKQILNQLSEKAKKLLNNPISANSPEHRELLNILSKLA